MELPAEDQAFVIERGLDYRTSVEANMLCVVFPNYPLPDGCDRSSADLLLRFTGGYPDVAPDMWWFDPSVRGINGETIQNTESMEIHLDRTWQRWSRHFEPGQWKSGIDGLESFLALINRELRQSIPKVAV